ncbi:hypothetical protein F2N28_08735 [Escherichia coli]|nr:hypothetical protein [Escherichia coli]EFD4949981.1 hypothetical protein [Escherichia coli]EFE8010974.1 hypothetical protein [Escherichia coli]EFI3565844.1 hypothetical protein [Escherichia coli]EFI4399863.1 hypothetical protein [Escherichia coli]
MPLKILTGTGNTQNEKILKTSEFLRVYRPSVFWISERTRDQGGYLPFRTGIGGSHQVYQTRASSSYLHCSTLRECLRREAEPSDEILQVIMVQNNWRATKWSNRLP